MPPPQYSEQNKQFNDGCGRHEITSPYVASIPEGRALVYGHLLGYMPHAPTGVAYLSTGSQFLSCSPQYRSMWTL